MNDYVLSRKTTVKMYVAINFKDLQFSKTTDGLGMQIKIIGSSDPECF